MPEGVQLFAAKNSWDALPIGVCVVNRRMEVTDMNGAMRKMALSPVATLPLALKELDPGLAASLVASIERVISTAGIEENIEAVLETASVRRRVLVTAFPLERESGTAVGLAVRDITGVHPTSTLREPRCIEMIQRMAGGIAHDFNNLLTVIMANATLMLDRARDARLTESSTREIIRASERAAELTRQMLAFSGKSPVYKTDVQVNDVIQELRPRLCATAPESIDVLVILNEALPTIRADRGHIADIAEILFRNAVEAINPMAGGRIEVETFRVTPGSAEHRQHGDCVCLSVTDTGSGIDGDVLPRIFDPFFTTKFPGRGLGLAAAKGLTLAHQGEIRVESERNAGTKATVFLPV